MVFFRPAAQGFIIALCLIGCVFPLSLHATGKSEKKGASREADRSRSADSPPAQEAESGRTLLAGTGGGLFSVDSAGRMTELWSGGSVKKILFVADAANDSGAADAVGIWAIMGSEGILVSTDLTHWERRNRGLPVKTIKVFRGGSKSFVQIPQEIKDLEINPADPRIMVCATKDRVYLSRDQGLSWESLGAPPYRTNGIKAVASAYLPGAPAAGGTVSSDLTVFLSHSTYGVYYIQPNRPSSRWAEINRGLETLETTGNADEVADIAVVLAGAENATAEIYASQTFRRRIYRLDWEKKTFSPVWSDGSPFGTVDSLAAGKDGLRFVYEGTVASIAFADSALRKRQDILDSIRAIPAKLHCVVLPEEKGSADLLALCELWLLDEAEPRIDAGRPGLAHSAAAGNGSFSNESFSNGSFSAQAINREGLYLPVNHAMDSRSLQPYLNRIQSSGLDMIVIDMKDDYGRLRFTPENTAISAKGRVFRPLDIDALLGGMKEQGIYTVARVVVFKDPELAGKENGRFAVWDTRHAKPWVGYHDQRRRKSGISAEERNDRLLSFFPDSDPAYEIVRTFYDERWVDPYSEEVWEYNAAVAEELHRRGFDEIQFDYIRFPTDGVNLGDARYRWQENGMDMESAILSFLRHIRSRVSAPISIDIYGANGWYRTGARTGQEVELLAPWVDVICPMYYPSHFEQDFLAHNPPEQRPWRIYFHGTLRTSRIGRGQAIVRPYVQAFFLNVSYDRKYYNNDYVRLQVEGTRAAGMGGFTFWNNSGRYDDIPAKE